MRTQSNELGRTRRAGLTIRCWRTTVLVSLLASALLYSSPSTAGTTHVVGPGHTLGKIAKRYHVSVEELCKANHLTQKTKLRLGQKLTIPGQSQATENEGPPVVEAQREPQGAFTAHWVSKGHTLGRIAKRYNTTNNALRDLNGLEDPSELVEGQCLLIPLEDKASEKLKEARLPCIPPAISEKRLPEKRRPMRAAQKSKTPGRVHIERDGRAFRGWLVRRGRVEPNAAKQVEQLLFDRRTNKTHPVPPRLLQLLSQVSDHFGGRKIMVVSGYRQDSGHTPGSKHTSGSAIDFRVEGVPNEQVRDFCLRFNNVGVGYYPNSSFIHLDVRSTKVSWVDISGPGQRPEYTNVNIEPVAP